MPAELRTLSAREAEDMLCIYGASSGASLGRFRARGLIRAIVRCGPAVIDTSQRVGTRAVRPQFRVEQQVLEVGVRAVGELKRRGEPREPGAVLLSATPSSIPVYGSARWMFAFPEPLPAAGQPQLVEEQPLAGPRHKRVGDREGLVPLVVAEEQAQSVQRVDVRKSLPL